MEREYEEAVTDLKAAIFDVVDSEKKTNASLKNMIDNEEDDDKKEELEEIYNKKKETLDTILSNIDSIIDNVELLDKINYDNNLKTDNIQTKVDEDTYNKDNDDEDENENDNEIEEAEESEDENDNEIEETEESEDENDNEIEETEESEDENDNEIEETEESEDENDNEIEEDNEEEETAIDTEEPIIAVEDENEEVEETEEESEDGIVEEDDEEPVLTEIKPIEEQEEVEEEQQQEEKLAFNKSDKTAPRAIMIIKQQEEKLKKSCDAQLEKVKTVGLLDDYSYEISSQNTINGDVIDQDMISKLNLEGKSIEDLTVLKQVYSDEGETDAVQAIEARMRELSGGEDNIESDEESEENTSVK